MLRSFAWTLFCCVLSGTAQGQYGAGGTGGTWEGIWGVQSQPASILLNPDRADINVLRFGVDLDNSYFQLSNGNIGLFGFGRHIEVNTNQAQLDALGASDRSVALDLRILGPSFSMKLGTRDAIGFTTGFRTSFSALDLDQLARKFGVDTLVIETGKSRTLDEVALRAAAISWSEFGPVYGHSFNLGENTRLHAAVTAKYALGLFAMNADLDPPVLSGLNDSIQTLTNVNLTYALALPTDPPLNGGVGDWANGHGWNGSGGLVLELLRTDTSASWRPHWLRVGVAVTDLGSINFNKRAGSYAIANGSTTLDDLDDMQVNQVADFDTALSSLLLHDPNASHRSSVFRMGLPAAAHASVDWSPTGPWAVRFEAVLSLRKPPESVEVRDQFSLVPRFETRMACVAVPLTVDRFGSVGLGISARVGGFLIGSDRLGALFGINRVTGADLYIGAKVRLRARPAN